MARSVKVSKNINTERLEIIHKGFVNVSDLQRFIPASRKKAQQEYELISREIMLNDGKLVGPFGIDIKRVLKHFGMSEQDIRRWAKDEIAG